MHDALDTSTSLWHAQIDGTAVSRPALGGDTDVDVAIVGAGYTGLWTAYSLLIADPTLRVLVVERETVGFGASGRNGGWASGLLAGSRQRFAKLHGVDAVKTQQRLMNDAIDVRRLARKMIDYLDLVD